MKKQFDKREYVIPQIKLPYAMGRKVFWMKKQDGFGDRSWSEYFVFLTKRAGIKLRDSMSEQIEEGTKDHLMDMWMMNFADNLPFIRFGDNLTMEVPEKPVIRTIADLGRPEPTLEKPPDGSAVIIGRGPSVWKNRYKLDGEDANHLDLLSKYVKEKKYRGAVCASDGMLIECLKRDIIPEITVSVDGSPIITKWYDHPLVKKHGSRLKIILPSTINHQVYKTCIANGCQVYWFSPMLDMPTRLETFTRIMGFLTKTRKEDKNLVAGQAGGNCGSCAWIMAMELLKRSPCAFIGIDMGYPEGTKLEDTPYFSSVLPQIKEQPQMMEHVYVKIHHPIYKTDAYFDAAFHHYRQAIIDMQKNTLQWYRHYGGTINCTEGGTLWGAGIECTTFKEFLDKYPT